MNCRFVLPLLLVLAACYTPPDAPATPSAWDVTGDGQIGIPGYRVPGPIAFRVLDANGRPVAGDTIDFTPSDPYALVEPASFAVTDSAGRATTYWRLGGTLGPQSLSAHSRIPGIGTATISATSRSNYVRSIGEARDVGLCAVDTAGRLGCWRPAHPSRHAPFNGDFLPATADLDQHFVPVVTASRFTQVAMLSKGIARGCALSDVGRVWCFTLDSLASIVGLSELGGSYPVFTKLVSGGRDADSYCALTAGGEAWCWGGNSDGQLGDGTMVARTSPVPVVTTARFSQVDLSASTVCALTFAGETWCWGFGGFATGSPVGGLILSPIQVVTSLRFSHIRLSAWEGISCGFVVIDEMYCWGDLRGFAPSPLGQQTAVPVIVPFSPRTVDLAEIAGFLVTFDQRTGLRWSGDPNELIYGDRASTPFPGSFPVTGTLREITLAHGYRHFCGTASTQDATLCISADGLYFNSYGLTRPFVVGVPLP